MQIYHKRSKCTAPTRCRATVDDAKGAKATAPLTYSPNLCFNAIEGGREGGKERRERRESRGKGRKAGKGNPRTPVRYLRGILLEIEPAALVDRESAMLVWIEIVK